MRNTLILLLLLPFWAMTQDEMKMTLPTTSITQHSVKLESGQSINYEAKAGFLTLKKEGKDWAHVFHTTYTKKGTNTKNRPITFAFNGGPGSSSVWLHMGMLGPKRIKLGPDGEMLKPPFEVVDNPQTWLEYTDLVFIDPVVTGFSRPAAGVDKSEFTGYREDIQSVGQFIQHYLSESKRWESPKYLAGESYGTTRAAGLSEHLIDRYGIYLNGISMISQITQFQTARFNRGNDLPYITFLPTYAATSVYHGRVNISEPLESFLDKVERFATGEYATALLKGDQLTDTEKKSIAAKLASFTGLSESYLLNTNLRINISRFVKELRRDEGIVVGRLDSRFTAKNYDNAGERYEFDPSYDGTIYGPFTNALYEHLQKNLKFEHNDSYEILTGKAYPWSYANVENEYLNVSQNLRSAMNMNPNMKVLVTNGYYDLATPYFASEYTMDHMFLPPELKANITMTYYKAGHMMYIHKPSLLKMAADVREFYKSSN